MKYSNLKEKEKAILFGVTFKSSEDPSVSLTELKGLCDTADVETIYKDYQYVREITPATLIGKGKVEELKGLVDELNADLVVFDTELSGSQISNLSNILGVKVLDRSMLILDIFALRAKTSEGKLQVELAQLKYTLPRLSAISGTSGRFGSGGVGMRGPGETKLELDKRVIQKNILKIEEELKQVKKQRQTRKSLNKQNNCKNVAIVGYTNAGKSTLLNLITKENVYADNKLFATLDTTSRKVYLGDNKSIILTDTVGFINKLPHAFIEAFNSTLEESLDADLLIHLVDASDEHYKIKKEVVDNVLKELKADNIPTLVVYNKIDDLKQEIDLQNELKISAKKNIGVDNLKEKIKEILFN